MEDRLQTIEMISESPALFGTAPERVSCVRDEMGGTETKMDAHSTVYVKSTGIFDS